MQQEHTIEIGLEVYKAIEAARESFDESQSDILTRLLSVRREDSTLITMTGNERPWKSKGVELPHGTQLRMTYNGCLHTAIIEDGVWIVGDDREQCNSPSGASYTVARTKKGDYAHIDGWRYWEALKPGERKWRFLDSLRP